MRCIPLLASVGICIAGAARAAPVAPTSLAWYNISAYVTAETGGCQTVGETYNGELQFIGSGKPGSKLLLETPNSSGPGNPDVVALTLPGMPTTNGGQSSGKYTGVSLPSGTPLTGMIGITIAWGTANAFFIVANTTTGNSCTATIGMTAIHSGK
jgi:hypothetical protein